MIWTVVHGCVTGQRRVTEADVRKVFQIDGDIGMDFTIESYWTQIKAAEEQ